MTSDVTLRQLRYFAAAAESGQFSLAAASMFVSQSAITNAILLLEERLAARLFDRKPHGVSLTAEGQRFYQHARHILDSLQDALREPRLRGKALSGAIRIAATYSVLGYFLPPLFARFRAHYPDIDFDLHDMGRREVEAAVLAGELELGVLILSNVEKRERFGHHVLMRSRRQLWAGAGHPLLAQPYPSLADIAQQPYILLTVDEGEESNRRYWVDSGLTPNIAFRTSVMEALRGLVAHRFGVTILSDMVYRPWSLEGKRIEARPILDAIPHLEVGLIWASDATLSDPAEALRQFLIQACGS
ncbi:LysR substrate-binding domain-containing protein [Accumulibacter sp.]|uniref:LysR substrate-binding domain-containing protein n=1 Tax=Accumulibacter sp. TaxID=2053492 RepID=UPI001D55EDEB|nr:LysR substrate-binding domain-containing protein [Accumulibacter sp.]MCB1931784.1 LysR family transcriptional regulator [Accumulibacter sp.]MCB1965318.1 LysR family transcriptional regulator [Accumulibacter sp.]MCP5227697.1 LysR family transcriptional regulator [Accumulibacter sp.]